MNELIENFRNGLFTIGELTETVLNALSLLCIVVGVVLSLTRAIQQQRSFGDHPLHTFFRRIFGGWLIVALELQLAADIVATIISPTYQDLIQLAAIALIRTFLNYFLNKELLEQTEILKRREESKKEIVM